MTPERSGTKMMSFRAPSDLARAIGAEARRRKMSVTDVIIEKLSGRYPTGQAEVSVDPPPSVSSTGGPRPGRGVSGAIAPAAHRHRYDRGASGLARCACGVIR